MVSTRTSGHDHEAVKDSQEQPWVVLPEGDEVFEGTVCLMRPDRSRPLSFRIFWATKAGALYAIIVFLIGFILGTIRVLLVAPRLDETTAVIIEAPIILAASWFVCRWCVDRLDVRRTVPARSLMGLIAFLVLMSAEVGLGAVVFGRSLGDQLAAYGSAVARSISPHR